MCTHGFDHYEKGKLNEDMIHASGSCGLASEITMLHGSAFRNMGTMSVSMVQVYDTLQSERRCQSEMIDQLSAVGS